MSDLILVIGNKNFSSWSLRAWLAVKQTGAPFVEQTIWIDEDSDRRQRRAQSPAGKVPILRHGDFVVWDSLAIGEYLHEFHPKAGLWPSERFARARARSLCAEMHSGFPDLRNELPMNVRERKPARERGPGVSADVRRIQEMWSDTRAEFGRGGPFLFGARSLADAYFAPVATRFRTYSVPLAGEAAAYCQMLLDTRELREWSAAAEAEEHSIEMYATKP